MISIIYHSAISIFCRFYYEIYGDIESSRFPIWGFDNEELLTNIYQAYFYIIVCINIYMINYKKTIIIRKINLKVIINIS